MTARLSFFVPGVPVPQGSKRVVRGRLIDSNSDRLRPWRDVVAWRARDAIPEGWDPSGAFRLVARFYFPRPKSHYTAAGVLRPARLGDQKTTRPDLDKLVRAVCDALTDAGVWGDDTQLVFLSAAKLYATPPDRPGAGIEIQGDR